MILIKVTAAHADRVIKECGSVWSDIVHGHPYFANDVLMARFPSSMLQHGRYDQVFTYNMRHEAFGDTPTGAGNGMGQSNNSNGRDEATNNAGTGPANNGGPGGFRVPF